MAGIAITELHGGSHLVVGSIALRIDDAQSRLGHGDAQLLESGPVQVQLSLGGAVPAGLRHAEALQELIAGAVGAN